MTAAQRRVVKRALDQAARSRTKGSLGSFNRDPALQSGSWVEPMPLHRQRSIFFALNQENGAHID